MPQTVFAVLALLMTTFFTLNQWRSVSAAQMLMVQNEVELMATEAAVDLQDYIATFPFDQNGTYGQGTNWDEVQDLDDFDGKSYTAQVVGSTGTVSFDATVEVRYVSKQGTRFRPVAEGTTSGHKEVVLHLAGPFSTEVAISRVHADQNASS